MVNDLSTVRSISTGSMDSGHLLKKADEIPRHYSKKIPAILKELEFRYNTNTTIFMMI